MTKVVVEVGEAKVEPAAEEATRLTDELGLLGTLASRAIASEIERATATVPIVRTPEDPVDALLLLRAVEHLRNLSASALDQELGRASEPQFTAGLSDVGDKLIASLGVSVIVYQIELPEGGVYVFWSSSGPYWTS